MSCSPSLRLLPGREARRAAAAIWQRDLPGKVACCDCPSEWPVAAVATHVLGSDHELCGGWPAEQPVAATLGGIGGLRGGSGGRERGVRVRWYVFSRFCRFAHVLFASNDNPSPFHMRRCRNSKDEDDAEVSATESE